MGRTSRLAVAALLLVLAPGTARAFQCLPPEGLMVPDLAEEPPELPPDPTLFWFSHADELMVTADGEPVPFTTTDVTEGVTARIVKVSYRGGAELVVRERFDDDVVQIGRYRIGGAAAPASREPLRVSLLGSRIEDGGPRDPRSYLTLQLQASRTAPVYRVTWKQGDYGGVSLIRGDGDRFSFGRSHACSSFDGPLLERGQGLSLTVVGLYHDGSETPPPEEPTWIPGDELAPASTRSYLVWIAGIVAGLCLVAAALWLLRRRHRGAA